MGMRTPFSWVEFLTSSSVESPIPQQAGMVKKNQRSVGHGHEVRIRSRQHRRTTRMVREQAHKRHTILRFLHALGGEHDQLGFEFLQSSHVRLQRLDRFVRPANIDGNADCHCSLLADACLLQFSNSETATSTHARLVFGRLAMHNRAKQARYRTRGDGGGLRFPLQAASFLLGGLERRVSQDVIKGCS